MCGVPLTAVVSGTATVWPLVWARLRAATVMLLPGPTARMVRVSCFEGPGHPSLSMRTVWPVAKPVTFVTLMVVAPALESAVRVAAAWTNIALACLVWHTPTIKPMVLALSLVAISSLLLHVFPVQF